MGEIIDTKMRKISFFIYSFFYLFFFFIVFYFVPSLIEYEKYNTLITKINNDKNTSIIIIYDDFKSSHGKLVLNTYNQACQYFSPVKTIPVKTFDYNKLRFDSFFYILNHLKKKHIYVNMSFSPESEFARKYMVFNLKKYAKDNNNTKFFIASGNNEYNTISKKTWSKINNNKNFLKIIHNNESFNSIFYKNLSTMNLSQILYSVIFETKKEKIKKILSLYVSNVKLAYSCIDSFLYTSQLDKIKNIYIISALDPIHLSFDATKINRISKKEVGIKYSLQQYYKIKKNKKMFLDCEVPNLSKNLHRDIGIYIKKEKNRYVPVIGTSIASPIFMARYLYGKRS